jgi:hypothetical protein
MARLNIAQILPRPNLCRAKFYRRRQKQFQHMRNPRQQLMGRRKSARQENQSK